MNVTLVESQDRALPFVEELLACLGAVTLATSRVAGEALHASALVGVDLLFIARSRWSPQDTTLCEVLRRFGPTAPILAVCGACVAQDRAQALRAGADDVLSIPFDVDELVARAFALVRRSTAQSRYARAGAISLDHARRQVLVDARPVSLTSSEYGVLAVLVDRAGQVVPRGELAELAQARSPGQSNVVAVHVSRLRRKLGAAASLIEAVRGVGYRLRQS